MTVPLLRDRLAYDPIVLEKMADIIRPIKTRGKSNGLAVYVVLGFGADENNETVVSNDHVAKATGLSIRSVIKAKDFLNQHGFITKHDSDEERYTVNYLGPFYGPTA